MSSAQSTMYHANMFLKQLLSTTLISNITTQETGVIHYIAVLRRSSVQDHTYISVWATPRAPQASEYTLKPTGHTWKKEDQW